MIAAVFVFSFILAALWAASSLSSPSRNDLLTVPGVRRAWPNGAGCSSCRCGAETASDGQSRDATRRAWLHFHVMKALIMRDLVVAHRCPGPPSTLVADSSLLSPRTSLGRRYGDGMGCERQDSATTAKRASQPKTIQRKTYYVVHECDLVVHATPLPININKWVSLGS